MPTLGAMQLHARGGSRVASFSLEGAGDAREGAEIAPGGGLRAGPRAGALTVVAKDGLCHSEARARVLVVGPFVVEPHAIGLARGGSVQFVAKGNLGEVVYTLLDAPRASRASARAAMLDAHGKFDAGDVEGVHHLVARDRESGLESRLAVTVGKPTPLRPRAPYVAVPAGGRVRLDWRGGSGALDVIGVTGAGNAQTVDGVMTFDATGASAARSSDVTVVDRFTKEKATVRVLLGATLGAPSVVRGSQSWIGDLASGDVNGDGVADLIVGHAERSKTAFEAGGILAYYGKPEGGFADPPDTIEGDHASDRYGSVLLVRDMNGDGIDDVVAGVPDEDLGEAKRGAVAVYLGAKGGLEREATRVLAGEGGNHRFGTALAVADLDGDGALDLVATAVGARSPFAAQCDGGRVYVFRNQKRPRDVFAGIPWQVIDLRDTLSDDPEAPLACSPTPLGGGRAVALLDMDGDRVIDLVVGAPVASYPQPGKSHGAVLVFRGLGDAKFEDAPRWSIHLDPASRVDNAAFGSGLDVVSDGAGGAPLLVVRSATFTPPGGNTSGAIWIVKPGTLGPPGSGGAGARKVRDVTTQIARLVLPPPNVKGFGRSAAIGDVDPSSGLEYVVGAAQPGAPGGAFVFAARDLAGSGALAPLATVDSKGGDLLGFRVTTLRGVGGVGGGGASHLAGLAVWAPWRTTAQGPFVGAIDYVTASPSSPASRWKEAKTVELPSFGASDRAGSAVALASFDGGPAPQAMVGAPGSHSPARAGHPAGEILRTGTIDVFGADPALPIVRAFVARQDAHGGQSSVVALDFDGDGKMELALADANETTGATALPPSYVDVDQCHALDAKGQPAPAPRGVVRIYGVVNGALVERFYVTAPKEAASDKAPDKGPRYKRNHFGTTLGVADVNGDGKQDLVVGRPGGAGNSGTEVVLGRKADLGGKVVVACNTGETGALGATVMPSSSPELPIEYGSAALARVGDLDRDGCDEIAMSITRTPGTPAPRAGVAIAFGYDASGARCGGHRAPFVLHVVPDDRPLADDVLGDASKRIDDTLDLRGATTSMGLTLASGAGDVTGDGVPDLVFRDGALTMFEKTGPAVEIISGAYLASLCPHRACPRGRTGSLWTDADYHVLALRTLTSPHRRVVPSDGIARGFGASIAIADVSGDGVADLAIGSSDATDEGAFSGEVMVFRGGVDTLSQEALFADPWLLAVGDITEKGAFGAAAAMATRPKNGGWLLVGAPSSSRNRAGGAIGAAYLWNVEVTR